MNFFELYSPEVLGLVDARRALRQIEYPKSAKGWELFQASHQQQLNIDECLRKVLNSSTGML